MILLNNCTVKITYKHLIQVTLAILMQLPLCGFAQSFKLINAIPHFPSFANNTSVSSPTVGMMIYNQATARPEIYTGSVWTTFANAKYAGSTNEDYFAILEGIPVLPSFSSAKSSDAGVVPKGTIYYDSSGNEIRVWNGTAWQNIFDLSQSESLTAGTSFELNMNVDGLQLPVLSSNPTGCEQGAIYINVTSKLITSFDGTSWNSYAINFVPVAGSVQQTGNIGIGEILTGSYVYSDYENDTEGTSSFRWYQSDSSNGASATVISGATSSTYAIQAGDLGKYIGFAVTPVASTGESPGSESIAPTFSGPVGTNDPPVAISVSHSGDAEVGSALTGSYDYSDTDGDTEGSSLYTWYRADDASGTNEIMLLEKSHEALSYTLQSSDVGYYFRFSVTPVATSGSSPGSEVKASTYLGPVIAVNVAPVAQNVHSTGLPIYNETLTGNYTFYDADGDSESGTTFKWYLSANSDGSSATAISGATNSTYVVQATDVSKYIAFAVSPAASSGTTPGTEAISVFYGPVEATWTCGASLTTTHFQGDVAPETVTITYATVLKSGKCFLAQNLGATSVENQTPSWYWQFNRKQGWKSTSSGAEGWFGVDIDESSDWNSANDPCSLLLGSTWRIPTSTEWTFSGDADDPYAGLNISTASGYLIYSSQTYSIMGANFWTSTQLAATYGWIITATVPGGATLGNKVDAFPLRCIKP